MTVLILGAGKGKRIGTKLPKILLPLQGRPMLIHILRTVERFSPEEIIIVVSPEGYEHTRKILGDESIKYVIQPEALGTADAVQRCRDMVHTRRVMILCGDVPLIRPQTLSDMIALHQSRGAAATLLSAELPDPTGYGRIIRNGDGSVYNIVEHKDASAAEREVREINSGTYIFEADLLFEFLKEVKPSPATGEYYLTDVIGMFAGRQMRVEALKIEDRNEVMGVNDILALKKVQDIFRQRLLENWRNAGASVDNPYTFFADSDVTLSPGAKITGRVVLRGATRIGSGASVGPFVHLEDTLVEGNNCIKGARSKKSSS